MTYDELMLDLHKKFEDESNGLKKDGELTRAGCLALVLIGVRLFDSVYKCLSVNGHLPSWIYESFGLINGKVEDVRKEDNSEKSILRKY